MKKIVTLTLMLVAMATAFTASAKPGGPLPGCYPCIVSK